MKILLQSRLDTLKNPAGDTTHLFFLKRQLEERGLIIDVSYDLYPDIEKYDLIHIFNISRPLETIEQVIHAKKNNKKVVIFPIYQNFSEWDLLGNIGLRKVLFKTVLSRNQRESIKNIGRMVLEWKYLPLIKTQLFYSYTTAQKKILTLADRIITTSEAEKELLEKDLNINLDKCDIIPHGVDPIYAKASPALFVKKFHCNNFILSVGNFSSRKNHINLIKAFQLLKNENPNLSEKLVLIGNPINTHKKYFKEIKKIIKEDKNIVLLTNIDKKYIASAYAAAKIHIIASWTENFPLVNLEAGLSDCNVISTNRSFCKEYLNNLISYCDPADINSIKKSLLENIDKPFDNKLKNYILNNLTWNIIAKKTIDTYLRIKKIP